MVPHPIVDPLKIENDDLKAIRENPLELFYQGIKAKQTSDKYTRTLRRILNDVLENILQGSDRAVEGILVGDKSYV